MAHHDSNLSRIRRWSAVALAAAGVGVAGVSVALAGQQTDGTDVDTPQPAMTADHSAPTWRPVPPVVPAARHRPPHSDTEAS